MPPLALETPAPGSSRRFRRSALLGWRCRRADESDQPFQCVLAVPTLRTESIGSQNNHSLLGHPASSQRPETLKHRIGQSRAIGSIEAQLNGACDLIDVLSTRSRSTNKTLLNLVLGKADGVSDAYHGFSSEGSATFLVCGRQSAVTDPVGRQGRCQPALNALRFHGLSLGPEIPTTKFSADAKIDPTGDGAPMRRGERA